MNLISQFGNYFRKSPAIIIVFVVLIVALAISISTTVEDYSTSYQGYIELPTRKINTWVIPMVAALPQVLQILMVYIVATDTSKRTRWALLIAILAHVFDVGLDVFYKSGGAWPLVPIALVETEVIYTLGSEFLLTLSFSLIFETFPDFVRQLNSVVGKSMDAIREVTGGSQHSRKDLRGNPVQQNQQRQVKMPKFQQPPPKFQQGMPPPKFQPPQVNPLGGDEDERQW